MTIRSGTPADIDAVLALWRDAETMEGTTDDPEALHHLFAFQNGALLVAEVDGTVVGAIIAAFDGWRGNVYRLAVLPEYRRRGIAAALADEGERRLRARGARRITALVLHEQPGAVAFWQGRGFEPDSHTLRHAKTL